VFSALVQSLSGCGSLIAFSVAGRGVGHRRLFFLDQPGEDWDVRYPVRK
jgi:hypothetical protein